MTPSETLVAAADLIRDLAAETSPAPWHMAAPYSLEMEGVGSASVGIRLSDARWIAALSPALAPHLEVWLREVAGVWATAERKAEWQGYARLDPSAFVGDDDRAALKVAQAILGSGVDTP